MTSTIERTNFSDRLIQALRSANYSSESPTQLAREFNIRFDGRAITVHAARKWLVGEAIPTQEKLRTLAEWLNVPADWLRFGGEQTKTGHTTAGDTPNVLSRIDSADLKLIADLQHLDEEYRIIAREFIRLLVRMNRKK